MLPYFLILPLWYAVAIGVPAIQSFHALQLNTPEALEAKKTWLLYWILYAVASVVLFYFQWLIAIPFFVLSFYIDIYYEVQLALAVYIVFPQFDGITKIRKEIENNSNNFGPILEKAIKDLVAKVKEFATPLYKKYCQ